MSTIIKDYTKLQQSIVTNDLDSFKVEIAPIINVIRNPKSSPEDIEVAKTIVLSTLDAFSNNKIKSNAIMHVFQKGFSKNDVTGKILKFGDPILEKLYNLIDEKTTPEEKFNNLIDEQTTPEEKFEIIQYVFNELTDESDLKAKTLQKAYDLIDAQNTLEAKLQVAKFVCENDRYKPILGMSSRQKLYNMIDEQESLQNKFLTAVFIVNSIVKSKKTMIECDFKNQIEQRICNMMQAQQTLDERLDVAMLVHKNLISGRDENNHCVDTEFRKKMERDIKKMLDEPVTSQEKLKLNMSQFRKNADILNYFYRYILQNICNLIDIKVDTERAMNYAHNSDQTVPATTLKSTKGGLVNNFIKTISNSINSKKPTPQEKLEAAKTVYKAGNPGDFNFDHPTLLEASLQRIYDLIEEQPTLIEKLQATFYIFNHTNHTRSCTKIREGAFEKALYFIDSQPTLQERIKVAIFMWEENTHHECLTQRGSAFISGNEYHSRIIKEIPNKIRDFMDQEPTFEERIKTAEFALTIISDYKKGYFLDRSIQKYIDHCRNEMNGKTLGQDAFLASLQGMDPS